MYEVKTKLKTFKFKTQEEAYVKVSELRNSNREWSLEQYTKYKESNGTTKFRMVVLDCST